MTAAPVASAIIALIAEKESKQTVATAVSVAIIITVITH